MSDNNVICVFTNFTKTQDLCVDFDLRLLQEQRAGLYAD